MGRQRLAVALQPNPPPNFVFPFFAAIYYWYPKITGRMYNERLGKIHFYLMLTAFYGQSLGQMQAGLLGMRRRIADYDPALGVTSTHHLITFAGFIIGLSVLIAFYNFAVSLRRGEVALALVRHKDYARAGVPMLPVVHGELHTRWQIFLYTLELVGLSLLLPLFGLGGSLYLVGALALGSWLLWFAWRVWKHGGKRRVDARSPAIG